MKGTMKAASWAVQKVEMWGIRKVYIGAATLEENSESC